MLRDAPAGVVGALEKYCRAAMQCLQSTAACALAAGAGVGGNNKGAYTTYAPLLPRPSGMAPLRGPVSSDLALLDAMLVDHLADGTGSAAGHAARACVGPGGALQRAVIAGHRIRCAAADGKQKYGDFLVHACLQ